MNKRFFAIMLAFVTALVLLPSVSLAAIAGEGYSFEESTGQLTITSASGMGNWKTDPLIAPASVTSLVFDIASETSFDIGTDAFKGCTGLRSVTIPGNAKTISPGAFQLCTNLTSVTFNNGVENIMGSAFASCTSLASVALPDSLLRIFASAFEDCAGLASLTLGNGLIALENAAFKGCVSLAAVTIPGSLRAIGDNAFENCTGLATLTVSQGVTIIGRRAFMNCTSLASVSLPASLTAEIKAEAFRDCSSLASISIPAGLLSIQANVFNGCTSLASVTLPSGLERINNGAFENCSSLTSVTLPNSLLRLGNATFKGCDKLASIDFGSGAQLTAIPQSAFENCSSLASIDIPASVTDIQIDAFKGCTGLTSVTLPSGLERINNNAFANCTKLAHIVCEKTTAPTLSASVFGGTTPTTAKLYIPGGATGYGAADWPDTVVQLWPVSGTVYASDGVTPVANAQVSVTLFADNVKTATTDANGQYTIPNAVHIGSNTVTASVTGFTGRRTVSVTAEAPVTGAIIKLKSATSSSGDAPPTSVTLYNDPKQTQATIWLTSVGLDLGDRLITETLSSGGDYNAMLRLAGGGDIFRVYNIYLRSGVSSTGFAMYLHMDLNEKYAGQDFTLVHKKADGSLEYFYATADANGDLEFGPLYELSTFMLAKGTLAQVPIYDATDVPQTGDSATLGLWIAMFMFIMGAGLAIGVVLTRRKRKA